MGYLPYQHERIHFLPRFSPAVSDDKVGSIIITDSEDGVVQAVEATAIQDTAGVELEGSGINGDCDWSVIQHLFEFFFISYQTVVITEEVWSSNTSRNSGYEVHG